MKDSPNKIYVDAILKVFSDRYKGKRNAVKTDDLIMHLRGTGVCVISGQTLRDILGHIRQNDLLKPSFILSNVNTGYWLSSDKTEMKEFLDQELNRMANQFGNLQELHKRLSGGKPINYDNQPNLFQ